MCEPISLEDRYSAEFRQSVGLLFLVASNVEAALGLQVARLICHPNPASVSSIYAVSGMGLKIKLATIVDSVRIITPNNRTAIEKMTTSIRRQFDHRNAIAHNANTPDDDEDRARILIAKLNPKGSAPDKVFNSDQITMFARILFERTRQVDDLLNKIGVEKIPQQGESS